MLAPFAADAPHLPKGSLFGGWLPNRLIRWAEKFSPSTARIITAVLSSRRHTQQGYRSCLGILRLGKSYDEGRLRAACGRAMLLVQRCINI